MAAPIAEGEVGQNVGKAIAHTKRQRERLLEAYLGGVLELAEFERKL